MAKSATGSAAAAMTPEEAYDNLRTSIDDPALDVLWRALRRTGEVIELTTNVMSSLPDDHASEQPLREFERLLEHDYPEFARRENFSGEADALSELQSVFDRMRRIRLAPHLASRNICSVAGGFSSGKSSLLNRLMGTDILPTKITPTTAIPTYVSHGDGEQTIRVFNHRGGSRAIEPPTLREMTHGFGSLREGGEGIPLKEIVSRVSIRTPRLGKQKLAFVDTPGYTNRGDGGVIEDEQTAMREVLESRFLIWVVDCERGELPQEDIRIVREFASRRAASEEPIYWV